MKTPINKYCPRSGKPVAEDSQTDYKGFLVGFCNPGCSGDFASNVSDRPEDRRYFDTLIKERDLDN
ncbi:MAG: YHS domain-containing protein [Verrucomicrobiota bacterium]